MLKIIIFLAMFTFNGVQDIAKLPGKEDGCFYDAQCPYIACYIVWCHLEHGKCYRVPNCV
jgi:hypothetical protein